MSSIEKAARKTRFLQL